jgi:Ala-tRNA(Pro) deacylase
VAKAVVLEDANGYIVGVVPSTNRLEMEWLNESLGRKLKMAAEEELPDLFKDCEFGAVPALSNAYGLDVIWDEQLTNASEVYIEAGDHESLIHLHGEDFCKLMEDLPHNIISTGRDYSRWIDD